MDRHIRTGVNRKLVRQTANHPAVNSDSTSQRKQSSHHVESANGVVVSVSSHASDVGLSVLKQGGNAVDAAIATAFALAVTCPPAGNIGGGGFMLVHPESHCGAPTVFDYRETAPSGAWKDMYTRDESQFTHRAVATPGTIRGMELAHRRFGTLPWSELLQPAIELADEGFCLDAAVAKSTSEILAVSSEFGELQRTYGKPGGGTWAAGDLMKLPDLARTLRLLAHEGPECFYVGEIGRRIAIEMGASGGLITSKDLSAYRAIERTPAQTRYRDGFHIYTAPAPSAGGLCLLAELNILNNFEISASKRWSASTIHLLIETMRRAQCDRARFIGDPEFVQIPSWIASTDHGRQQSLEINRTRVTPSISLAPELCISPEGPSTTHFGVIDRNGMAVSNTYTLERRWGSRIVVPGMGFLLNNNMRAFNLFQGQTDTRGAVGTAPNVIEPNKRPISSMAPTIVVKDDQVKLITGSTGSRAIPNTILNILVSALDYDMPLEDAVSAPRISHEWFPDHVRFEMPERVPETVRSLREMGHKIVAPTPLPFQGDAHSIGVLSDGTRVGVADTRISGKASGY